MPTTAAAASSTRPRSARRRDVVSSWKVPGQFLEAGYAQPSSGANDQNASRMRQNAEFIWKELK
jgi:hypothetical protein